MKQRKIPMRRCVITMERCPKQELMRVVKNKEDQLAVDLTGKMNGRGAYIKKDLEVIKQARKNKKLENQLGIKIPDEIYDELEKVVTE